MPVSTESVSGMRAFCWGNFVANSFAKSTDDEVADREAYEQDAVLKLSEAEAKRGRRSHE
jgi:hypothetical protein